MDQDRLKNQTSLEIIYNVTLNEILLGNYRVWFVKCGLRYIRRFSRLCDQIFPIHVVPIFIFLSCYQCLIIYRKFCPLTLNIPSLARQLCLSIWGPRRTPCFFFLISQLFDAADYSNYVLGVSETIIQ